MSTTIPPKDPDATLDYEVDWSAWLAAGETITAAEITAAAGVNLNPSGHTTVVADGKVTFWLSGGTAGMVYLITCHITTSAGRIDERTVKLPVLER